MRSERRIKAGGLPTWESEMARHDAPLGGLACVTSIYGNSKPRPLCQRFANMFGWAKHRCEEWHFCKASTSYALVPGAYLAALHDGEPFSVVDIRVELSRPRAYRLSSLRALLTSPPSLRASATYTVSDMGPARKHDKVDKVRRAATLSSMPLKLTFIYTNSLSFAKSVTRSSAETRPATRRSTCRTSRTCKYPMSHCQRLRCVS